LLLGLSNISECPYLKGTLREVDYSYQIA
jgi:hypothetical protein